MGGAPAYLGTVGSTPQRPRVNPARQALDLGKPVVNQEGRRLQAALSDMTVHHDRRVFRPLLDDLLGQGVRDQTRAVDAGDRVLSGVRTSRR